MTTSSKPRLIRSTSVLIESFRAMHADDQAFVLSQINTSHKVPDSVVYLARKIGELEGTIKTSLAQHELRVERIVRDASKTTTKALIGYFEGDADGTDDRTDAQIQEAVIEPHPKVLAYGLIGAQSSTLKELLKPYPLDVTCVERSAIPPKASFDYVVVSRWVNHSDTERLAKHNTKVEIAFGGAATMAAHILAHFNLVEEADDAA